MFSTFWWLIVWTLVSPFVFMRLRTWLRETEARARGVQVCQDGSHGSARRAFGPEDSRSTVTPQREG